MHYRLRDLNDEINKLIREKGHWERRIVELGGPDYSLTRQKVTDSDGKEVSAASGKGAGYRYFGAAKNLPGVKELFEKAAPRKLRRTRFDMHKAVDADYYGFRDEDDGILVKVEAEAERTIKKRVCSYLCQCVLLHKGVAACCCTLCPTSTGPEAACWV
jgi:pre-mRNA-splicing factor ISY1